MTAEERHRPYRRALEIETGVNEICRERFDHALGAHDQRHAWLDARQIVRALE
jgi:hypothetical protein